MKTPSIKLLTLALGLSCCALASAQTMTKAENKAAIEKIEATYKIAHKACDSLSGNAKDICVLEAKGNEKVAKADLDAAYEPSAKSHRALIDTKAETQYAVSKEKCDDLAGNFKDVCLKEAKATEISAKADAKLQLKTTDANMDAQKTTAKAQTKAQGKVADASVEATTDKIDAQYKVEKERCDALAGDAKDNCVSQAKARFAK
ncbi:MAG: hypothetical protein H7Y28_09865 [Rhodoferax sp.]|nr:hypothetical protein [Rhodoferax sp.]